MATKHVRTTVVRMTESGTLGAAAGPRVLVVDATYQDVTVTLPSYASSGMLDVRTIGSYDGAVTPASGETVNGNAGSIALAGGDGLKLIPGTTEWLMAESLIIE